MVYLHVVRDVKIKITINDISKKALILLVFDTSTSFKFKSYYEHRHNIFWDAFLEFQSNAFGKHIWGLRSNKLMEGNS